MLPLDYDAKIPRALIELLEHHARRFGMPLARVEQLGRDLELLERFLVAVEQGQGRAWARSLPSRSLPTGNEAASA